MSLVLAIDIRNTHTRLGLAADGVLASQWALGTDAGCTVDEAVAAVATFFDAVACGLAPLEASAALSGDDLPACAPLAEGAIVASVFPSLTEVWVEAARRVTSTRPLTVGPGLKSGLRMAFSDPASVGADRVAEMVAAKEAYGAPVLVVDLGTSTTFEFLDRDGSFKGGIIACGMRLGAEALASGAAQLPSVELRAPRSLLGRTTAEAMQSGIVMGEVARIDGLIDMIWADAGFETPVVLTGRGAEAVAALMGHAASVDQTLGLRGLVQLHAMNRR